MKQCVLLLLAFACVHGAPAGGLPPSSCKDASTVFVAGEAIEKINQDRTKGYIFSMERVSNVHQTRHGETGVVYYLTIDVLETKCHVLSKKSYKDCENRQIGGHPVYGQCKAVIYINKPQRVARLYKYSCTVRPVPASKIVSVCSDCPTLISVDNEEVEMAMKMGLEKFNKESMLPNYFAPLNITKATMQGGILTLYTVEFTIQETVCSNKTDISEASKCDVMSCEFAHKGFCQASHSYSNGNEHVNVDCEIYEPETAEEEEKNHLSKEMDHHHENIGGLSLSHDHTHDHTLPHSHPPAHHDHDHTADHKDEGEHAHDHSKNPGHHHTHEHDEGHGKAHGHAHSHEHSHDHDHVHVHHGQAHNHTQDQGIHAVHHNYGHAEGETHEHDHELALDHQHKHGHLHEHEHHHHHHQHPHETGLKRPEGTVRVLPSLDKPMLLPSFPDQLEKPDTPTGLPLRPDPQIPGQMEPVIVKFPNTISSNCPAEFKTNSMLIKEVFAQDPVFKIKRGA